jgi:hypothetical protein
MKWRLLSSSLMVVLVPVIYGCSHGGEDPLCTDSTTSCHFDCATTVEAFCAESVACTATWDEALTDRRFCTTMTDVVTGSTSSVYDCGNYHILETGGEGGGVYRYYDRATGMLVAVLESGHSQPPLSCVGGPVGEFDPPDCPAATPVSPPICSTDGGADGL